MHDPESQLSEETRLEDVGFERRVYYCPACRQHHERNRITHCYSFSSGKFIVNTAPWPDPAPCYWCKKLTATPEKEE